MRVDSICAACDSCKFGINLNFNKSKDEELPKFIGKEKLIKISNLFVNKGKVLYPKPKFEK